MSHGTLRRSASSPKSGWSTEEEMLEAKTRPAAAAIELSDEDFQAIG